MHITEAVRYNFCQIAIATNINKTIVISNKAGSLYKDSYIAKEFRLSFYSN